MQDISTAHMEHGVAVLAELDLGKLFAGFAQVQSGDSAAAIPGVMSALGQAAEGRVLRRLVAIASASTDDLIASESDATIIKRMVDEAAKKPFKESLAAAKDFLEASGLFDAAILGSLNPVEAAKDPEAAAPAIPSDGS